VSDKVFVQVKSSHWGLIDENKHAIALEEKAQHIFDSSGNQEIVVTQNKKGYRNHEANDE
jgi:hypothetical protein